MNRQILADAARLLSRIEDWLHSDCSAAAEFAGFLHHTGPRGAASRTAAVLIDDIGQIAACLHHPHPTNTSTANSEEQPR